VVETFDAVHRVLDGRPRGADTELQAAARQVVDGDRKLGEEGRISVCVAGDHAADPYVFRGLGHRGLQGPAFIDRPVGAARADGSQVVEVPNVVETAFVSQPPDGPERIDRRVLARQLHAEAHCVFHPVRRRVGLTRRATWY